jgi:hypothetical protein
VYGNIDDSKVISVAQLVLCVKSRCFGLRILAVIRKIQSNIKAKWNQILQIIYLWTFAHPESHFDKKNNLCMNPGAAGKVDTKVRTMLRFVIEGDKIRIWKLLRWKNGCSCFFWIRNRDYYSSCSSVCFEFK